MLTSKPIVHAAMPKFLLSGVHKVSLNRLPTGGFSWDFYLSPAGHKPPEPEPERPSGEDDS